MAKSRVVESSSTKRKMRPALSPEARENQLISLAVDLAERQLMEGTASSQVIAHFLKRGSVREQLEMERLREENALLRAKTEAFQTAKNTEELYANDIKAMKRYSGNEDMSDEEWDDR